MRRGAGRMVAGAAGAAVLLGLVLVPPPQQTEAAPWGDQEVAVASAVTALNVPELLPNATPACTATGLLNLAPEVKIWWKLPPGAAAAGYTVNSAEYGQIVNQGLLEPILSNLLSNVSTTASGDGYVTTISGTLLANLLGGKKTLGIRLVYPGPRTPAPNPDNRWRSDWLVANAEFGALSINNKCTVSTAASY
ncbi:hypothetical protein [Streptomyces sp. AC495_CC817]|uniref:hypothetical protein n=1 Tax=Streptomyces sp. AC495_CC817 TaxID=2823900 RepID=UPI001C2566B0|nr:hypothetical protein [Streptomyces sp. AC495_CC817]